MPNRGRCRHRRRASPDTILSSTYTTLMLLSPTLLVADARDRPPNPEDGCGREKKRKRDNFRLPRRNPLMKDIVFLSVAATCSIGGGSKQYCPFRSRRLYTPQNFPAASCLAATTSDLVSASYTSLDRYDRLLRSPVVARPSRECGRCRCILGVSAARSAPERRTAEGTRRPALCTSGGVLRNKREDNFQRRCREHDKHAPA